MVGASFINIYSIMHLGYSEINLCILIAMCCLRMHTECQACRPYDQILACIGVETRGRGHGGLLFHAPCVTNKWVSDNCWVHLSQLSLHIHSMTYCATHQCSLSKQLLNLQVKIRQTNSVQVVSNELWLNQTLFLFLVLIAQCWSQQEFS